MQRKNCIGQHKPFFSKTRHAYENLTLYGSIIGCVFTFASSSVVFSQSASTSPLSILSEAPTVKMEDTQPLVPRATPAPTPKVLQPAESQTGYAPRPAPTYSPVNVPQGGQQGYSGQSVSRQGEAQGFVPPAPAYQMPPNAPRPTPPSNEPREGFFKGVVRAIPFVGSKIAGPEKSPIPMPREQSWRTSPLPKAPVEETPEYQGLSTPIISSEPGSSNVILKPPADETQEVQSPYSAESMKEDKSEKLDLSEGTATSSENISETPHETSVNTSSPNSSNVLTVKVDETTGTVESIDKKPEVSPDPKDTPIPLDDPAEAPVVQKRPAVSDSYEKTTATTEIITPAVTGGTAEIVVQDSDLGMPNPAYEENSVILAKFQEAVKSARSKDYETAARQFREYANFHPSSGLTPRALFLAIVFEKDNAIAEESRGVLKSRFPENRYVKDADKRRPPVKISAGGTVVPVEPIDNELPSDKAARLDKELTRAVGDAEKEPKLRIELAQTYVRLDQYDRAMEVLRPALDQVKGKPEEADALILLAECQIAKKDVKSAAASLVELMEKYPDSAKKPKAAWNIGLVYEESGRYEKARAIYNDLKTNFPDTQEAKWAEARLKEISSLSD